VHFILMLVFLVIWLLTLWFGSIALQKTGMQRYKANFQALSALTGSGFTTGEAEAVVNNRARRHIISWMMFIGNAGALLLLIAIILYVKAAIVTPSIAEVIIILSIVLSLILFFRLGAVDKLSDMIVGRSGAESSAAAKINHVEILHQIGDHAVALIAVGGNTSQSGSTLKCAAVSGGDLTILSIERGNTIIQLPALETTVQPGDQLLCYGNLAAVNNYHEDPA
jgi:hypothetical protein